MEVVFWLTTWTECKLQPVEQWRNEKQRGSLLTCILTDYPRNKSQEKYISIYFMESKKQKPGIDFNSRANCSSYVMSFSCWIAYFIFVDLALVAPIFAQFPNLDQSLPGEFLKNKTDMQLHSAPTSKLWPNRSPPASVPLLALRPPDPIQLNQLATLQRCL